jgi:RHS repeat-associated protein
MRASNGTDHNLILVTKAMKKSQRHFGFTSRQAGFAKLAACAGVTTALFLALLGSAHAAEKVTYYYTNEQGTPLVTADAAGVVSTSPDYRPYGAQAQGSPVDGPGYTGHVADADVGLVYMQARYYDPQVGRFLSTDPVGPIEGSLFNFGRYAYADNNPVLYIDADGQQATEPRKLYLPKYSMDPRKDPLFSTVGNALAADAAYAVGWATDDAALQDAAVEAMSEATTGGQGSAAAITLLTMGKGGEEITVVGVKMEPTATGARSALESAGYPGQPISNKSATETGTLHNIPQLEVDVRVMDGGPKHPARLVTTKQGSKQAVDPKTGRPIGGNLPKKDQRAINHIPLRDKP